jgi:ParB family chromosome partitioning protein
VPIAIKDFAAGNEKSLLEMALIENIQREDLNPIEEALAYHRLAEEFHLKQEDIASAVGKDRATVANHIRLLRLHEEVRAELSSGRLTMGHARALLSLTDEADQRRVAGDVIARALSVRETESLVKKMVEQSASRQARTTPEPTPADVHTRAAEERLRFLLGTQVRIVRQGDRGRIEIDFVSENELIRIFEQLTEK